MFDVIVGNPPYQSDEKAGARPQSLWHKFVERGIFLCKKEGFFSMIHPSGWREPNGMFKKTGKLILSKKILFVTLYGVKRGIEIFGVGTSCDWYILQNCESKGNLSKVKFQDNSVEQICLSDVEFIPNSRMSEIMSLIAKPEEEKTEVMHSRSAYGSDKSHVSKEKTEEFRYPIVYTCPSSGKINFRWSNTNKNGHFGVPKVIWSNGSSSVHIDSTGQYGLTQFAYAIVDEPKNLPMIKKALESERFIELMKACALNNSHRYNHKVIALFRKDFWKEFV